MSERSEVKRLGAKAQKNSGRGSHDKGDAKFDHFLIDFKEYSEGFTVSRKVWAKISSDAFKAGRLIPALALVLGQENKVRLWVVDDATFLDMKEAYEEKYG